MYFGLPAVHRENAEKCTEDSSSHADVILKGGTKANHLADGELKIAESAK